MAFVNEYISPQDRATYGIQDIDRRYVVGGISAGHWTIDRDRDIYLRQVANGPREIELFHQGVWTLCFEGELIEIGIDLLSATGGLNQPCTSHMAIRHIDLPASLATRRAEIVEVLREALLARKDGGVYSGATSFTLVLDV